MVLVRSLRPALAAAALLATTAHAGVGAELFACVEAPAPPAGTSWTATFTPGGGGTYCMDRTGHPGAVTVSAAGLACASLGTVASRTNNRERDSCQLNPARMPLAWAASPGVGGQGPGYGGATTLQISNALFGQGRAVVDTDSLAVTICPDAHPCTATAITWKKRTRGPLYVIFQPPSP